MQPYCAALPSPWRPTHRHYKGGLYRVVSTGLVLDEASMEQLVIYEDRTGRRWARLKSDFDSKVYVENDETTGDVPRFAPLSPAPDEGGRP